MREIKFRAFVDGEMYPVTNLDYIQDGSGIIAHIHVKGINQEIPSGQFKLMQYTGLKDKNGVEIYEGDILEKRYMDIYEIRDENNEFVRWSNHDDKKEYIDHYEIKWIMDTVDLHSEYAELYNGFMAVHTKFEHRRSGIGEEFKFTNCGGSGIVTSRLEVVGNIFEGVDK